jgi:sigma-54 specific flagellar transcriptional regulator A
MIDMLVASSSTVLICGESGTGKELVAQALHHRGPRRQRRFVPINCGAIPKELLESELFGHRKGAFTGALADRFGRFELAHGGTLFLDEVGDLPADMQVKLLRVLEERSIVPLGSNKPIEVDVRVVAATHKVMEREVSEGRFREDLYYRLNVLPMYVPSLRERADDIPELVAFYADRYRGTDGRVVRFNADLMDALQRYPWPGNVRELCNLVDRFSTFFPGEALSLKRIPDWLLPSGLSRIKSEMLAEACTGQKTDSEERQVDSTVKQTDYVLNGVERLPFSDDEPMEPASLEGLLMMAQSIDPQENATVRGSVVSGSFLRVQSRAPETDVASHPIPGNGWDANVSAEKAEICDPKSPKFIEVLQPEGISLKERLTEIERNYIVQALERSEWNVSKTARLLSLQRTTLIEKMNRFKLSKDDRA